MPKHLIDQQSIFSVEQLYLLVKDIEQYPKFIPWCTAARILSEQPNMLVAELVIGYKGLIEKYTSKIILTPPDSQQARIEVEMTHGPFKYLINNWHFISNNLNGCNINFFIDFSFKSKILEKIMGSFFDKAVCKMVNAFEDRAKVLYHKPKI